MTRKSIAKVRVMAARRGVVVAAMTDTRERMAKMRSRRHNGQFYGVWSAFWKWEMGGKWVHAQLHTKGSFGSSLGCGTRMIVPVLSFFRWGSS